MNYSKVKSVISGWGSALTASGKRKGASVSCWLREPRRKQDNWHRQSVTVMLWNAHPSLPTCITPCLLSPGCSLSLSSDLSSCGCCIINLACLKIIVLYLTSQSIARIALSVPRVFAKRGTNNEFCQQFSQVFFLFFLSPLEIGLERAEVQGKLGVTADFCILKT